MMFENENQEWVTHMEKQKTIQQMQAEVDRYIDNLKKDISALWPCSPACLKNSGELAREVNHYHGEKPKKATEEENTIEAELGDMLFVLICFANSLGIELQNSHDLVNGKFTIRDKDRWTRKEEEMEEEGKDE